MVAKKFKNVAEAGTISASYGIQWPDHKGFFKRVGCNRVEEIKWWFDLNIWREIIWAIFFPHVSLGVRVNSECCAWSLKFNCDRFVRSWQQGSVFPEGWISTGIYCCWYHQLLSRYDEERCERSQPIRRQPIPSSSLSIYHLKSAFNVGHEELHVDVLTQMYNLCSRTRK